ncbi:MAG: hypothetical protein IKD69_01380 [Solobacterium sp.]|nr:hypothetical protein [Solobacterium sp.]
MICKGKCIFHLYPVAIEDFYKIGKQSVLFSDGVHQPYVTIQSRTVNDADDLSRQ